MYFDEDERGAGSLRPGGGGGFRPQSGGFGNRRDDFEDRLDNLPRGGGRNNDRRGGGGGGGGGGRRGGGQEREPAVGPLYRGSVAAMREESGFGFVRPDPASGLRPTDIFFHFVTGLAEESDIDSILVGSPVEFYISEGKGDGKKRATQVKLAGALDPTASLRPVFGLGGGVGGGASGHA